MYVSLLAPFAIYTWLINWWYSLLLHWSRKCKILWTISRRSTTTSAKKSGIYIYYKNEISLSLSVYIRVCVCVFVGGGLPGLGRNTTSQLAHYLVPRKISFTYYLIVLNAPKLINEQAEDGRRSWWHGYQGTARSWAKSRWSYKTCSQ